MPRFWPARRKKTWMQTCPPSAWAAKMSASSIDGRLIDWCDWMCASARMRSRSTAACSNCRSPDAFSMRCDSACWTSRLRPPRKSRTSLDDRVVLGLLDAADAGRRAALDLVLQAGPRAGREHAVGAGAQREGALQGVERAVDRGGRGERAEILVARLARAAVLGELRPFGVAADDDVGERLVVAQQHVEARPEALDQVVLEQQRLGLAVGDRRTPWSRVAETMRISRVASRVGWV